MIECPSCHGTGKIELWPVLMSTLRMVPAKGWISTTDIFRRNKLATTQKISPEALVNRLMRLELLGLVASKTPAGRLKLWHRI
jgi:hypothetical protein